MRKIAPVFILVIFMACGQASETTPTNSDTADKAATPAMRPENIPLDRDTVNPEPVAEYREKTDNPLNDWYFQVRIFETDKTFHYLLKLQFEEIRGQDTLKLPNFGMMPKPVIQKGADKFSCIIGFMDKDNQFREYKKVYVRDNVLKITALKHYGVKG